MKDTKKDKSNKIHKPQEMCAHPWAIPLLPSFSLLSFFVSFVVPLLIVLS
jgi:hypothetical protein